MTEQEQKERKVCRCDGSQVSHCFHNAPLPGCKEDARRAAARTQQAAGVDKQRRVDYVINVAISRLRSVDRALKGDGYRIDEGSTREKIKHSISELERLKTAQPDKAEVERFAVTIAENLHMDEDDPRIVRAARILAGLPTQRADSGLVDVEALDRAIRKYHPELAGKRAYAGEIAAELNAAQAKAGAA